MTFKTGTIGGFMQWTKRVITDPAAASGTPKQWFDSNDTANKALGAKRAEALVKLLSKENMALLHLIERRHPASLRELAALAGRKESNLSRTLKKLEEIGIVGFEKGNGRMRAPRLLAHRVTLDLDLVGKSSAVSVDPRKRSV
ncbi:MAG: MarR family transcriptional regulator [Hyphomicrobiales bacterium]